MEMKGILISKNPAHKISRDVNVIKIIMININNALDIYRQILNHIITSSFVINNTYNFFKYFYIFSNILNLITPP